LEVKLKKNKSQFLDFERVVGELEKNLEKEKNLTTELNKEIRELKKAHLGEIDKIS